jgi:hypothetical protein
MQDKPLQFEDFADKVGQEFRLNEPGLPAVPFNLKQTEPLPMPRLPSTLRSMRPPFSLIFFARHALVFPQRLYRLEHATMGALTIFLVPIGREADGVSYQAVFN